VDQKVEPGQVIRGDSDKQMVNRLGFDSLTHYQFAHFIDMNRDYTDITKDLPHLWSDISTSYRANYYPHVSVGWDSTPRTFHGRSPTPPNNTPENFEKALRVAKKYADEHTNQAPLITINSWNEWTETSYLEPDTKRGYGYLEAVKRVFLQNLALAANGATAISDSEKTKELGCTGKVIDGVIATPDNFSNRWHSSVDQPHPHWVEVHLAKPSKISTVVIHFADPHGYPVSFEGTVRVDGQKLQVINETDSQETQVYRAKFEPVTTDVFRLTILASANRAFPNAAQISEIELYP